MFTPGVPLIVVDANAFFHALVLKSDELSHSPSRYITVNTQYLLLGTLFERLLPDKEFQIVFCMDTKPYWRDAELKKIGINYKGRRQARAQIESLLTLVRNTVASLLLEQGGSLFQKWVAGSTLINPLGYEADDLAAAISIYCNYTNTPAIFFTDDTDWLPFLENPNNTWCGVHHRKPRIRTKSDVILWMRQCKENQKSKARAEFISQMQSPLDFWEYKVRFGDNADALPANTQTQHNLTPYINLYQPPQKYRAWTEVDFLKKLGTAMFPVAKITPYHEFVDLIGHTSLFCELL